MIDHRQHDEENEPEAQAPADQFFLDGQQRLDGSGPQFLAQVTWMAGTSPAMTARVGED